MLATVILDTYTQEESELLADALEEVASAKDHYGWSSSGIYCFWNPSNKEVLYIGLAVDLPNRFRQHNGLIACPVKCCKRDNIRVYFETNTLLGYSVLVQSNLSQGVCERWEKANRETLDSLCERYEFMDREEAKRLLNIDVHKEIRTYEGALIEAVDGETGSVPPWNKIKGADIKFTDADLKTGNYLLGSLTSRHDGFDPLAAHVRLRDLSERAMYQGYEELLHSTRMLILGGASLEDAYRITCDSLGYFEKMRSEGYNTKKVLI